MKLEKIFPAYRFSPNPPTLVRVAQLRNSFHTSDTGVTAEEYTEEPHEATKVSNPNTAADRIFLENGHDFAFAGSSSPVHSTR